MAGADGRVEESYAVGLKRKKNSLFPGSGQISFTSLGAASVYTCGSILSFIKVLYKRTLLQIRILIPN